MKALTVHPVYAMCIVGGQKTVECRTWKTSYRGPILICSSAKKFHGSIPGHALGVVDLVDVVPFKREHIKPSMEDGMIYDAYAWIWKTRGSSSRYRSKVNYHCGILNTMKRSFTCRNQRTRRKTRPWALNIGTR